ncbi:MAG: glycosyltransferase family 39 protein, partial [Chloroflexi bacterium]|nr:glycosyltransferase family 39 protein [Chloroflexota bacterium]
MSKDNNSLEELSVLDYFKELITPWSGPLPKIPPLPKEGIAAKVKAVEKKQRAATLEGIQWAALPWRLLAALFLAFLAQINLEPPNSAPLSAMALYLIAAGLLVWANLSGEWSLAAHRDQKESGEPLTANAIGLAVGLPLAGLAFWFFGGNRFTPLNLILWGIALLLIIWALWLRNPESDSWVTQLRESLAQSSWNLQITRFGLVFMVFFGISIFFRIYQLNEVPGEMFSDHIEKLLDIYDVQNGQRSIFFPRNTGREGFQMYLTSWIIDMFNTGYSFLSLKLGMVAMGILMLPYMYLLGKEVGNRNVGLIAMILTGIAFWPNIMARVGLRHILFPVFVAPTLFYLIRGIRTTNRNDFIFSGIALGISLHGYSPIRVLPFVLVLAVILFMLHRHSQGTRHQIFIYFGILTFVAVILFLPLARYITEDPINMSIFNYRALTRVGTLEQPYPGSPVVIFFQNLWDALLMINFTNSSAWSVSVPNRPMIDFISASLFLLGVILLVVRYAQERHWLDIFLLLSIPLLMMPSIISIAFPIENPTANRAGGALVPVFIIAALALESIYRGIRSRLSQESGTRLAVGLAVFLIGWSALLNYGLTFNTFATQYNRSAWNSSEMGAIIAQFTETIGDKDNAWVVVYP